MTLRSADNPGWNKTLPSRVGLRKTVAALPRHSLWSWLLSRAGTQSTTIKKKGANHENTKAVQGAYYREAKHILGPAGGIE
jgi:hypothetical protein